MNIKDYSYVLALSQAKSYSKAAEALFISQPSLSGFIKNIERNLGLRLVDKENGAIAMTEAGQIYARYAQRMVALDAAMHRELDGARPERTASVAMGITQTRSGILLAKFMPEFKRTHPGASVRVVEAEGKRLEELMTGKELDFAVMAMPLRNPKLESYRLYGEEAVLVAAKGHPVAALGVKRPDRRWPWIDLSALGGEQFILSKQGQHLRQAADWLFLRAGVTPDIVLETGSALTAFRLAAAGVGLTIAPDKFCSAINQTGDAVWFSIGEEPVSNDVALVCRKMSALSPGASALAGAIMASFQPQEGRRV